MKSPDSVFDGLNEKQTEYVTARSKTDSNLKALKECGLSEGWLYKNDYENLNYRALMLRKDVVRQATQMLSESLVKAVEVKLDGLKVRDERIKQAVSTEIIERIMGKPTQRTEVTGKDGGAIEVDDARESIQRKLAGISAANGEG